ADIFPGKTPKWTAPATAKLNPDVKLPGDDITGVHRSDSSGTTYIWVDYLSKTSPEFMKKVGVNTAVNWPTGVGGKGNEGVSGLVRQTPGSLGYVELIYALQNKISYGSVQNAGGEFVKASVSAVTAAANEAASKMPADFRVSITNAPGKGVYPISSFTWLLLYENPKDKAQAKAMVDFMKWALTDGQKYCGDLGYAPLPESVVKLEMAALARVRTSQRAGGGHDAKGSGLPHRDGPRRRRARADRRRDRLRAGAAVDALDSEVRPLVLAHGNLGPGRGAVRRAAVHLGHAVLVDRRAGDLDADRAGHRGLHLGALSRMAAAAAGVPHRAAGRDPVDRLRPVGDLRARPGDSRARGVDADRAPPAAFVQRSAARGRHALRGRDPGGDGDSLHLLGLA